MARVSRRALVSSSLSSFLFTYATTTTLTDLTLSSKSSNSSVKAIKLQTSGKRSKRSINSNFTNVEQNAATQSYSTQSSHSTYNAGYNKYVPYTAQPTLTAATLAPTNKTIQAQILAAERERIRAEFFATYDVMTGVRIAATLGGFFGLMVFLIVWKSRSSSNETLKVLKDPKMAAVAAVCMQEEEDREIQEAMVATGMSIFPDEYDAIAYRRQRMLSLGNVSAPPMLNREYRFSSVGGGYNSLLAPPRRFSYSATSAGSYGSGRRKSISESSRIIENFPMGNSFGADDYFIESEDEMESVNDTLVGNQKNKITEQNTRTESSCSKGGLLEVPPVPPKQDSRRSSSMTCCSTESSYLERRYSAFTLGLGILPQTLKRNLSTTSHTSSPDNWDYFYPDIQVIQPTPKLSPCPSERCINGQTQTTNKSKTVKSQRATNGKKNILDGFPLHGSVIRKQSIAFYDPEKAQIGQGQHIHSISADVVDVYPYNQIQPTSSIVGVNQGFHYAGIANANAAEIIKTPLTTCASYENKNYSYKSTTVKTLASTAGAANSSSISIDSTPLSIEKLNGSGSLGTISAKVLFNGGKRAPLASLSSFKISSLEYPDSEYQSRNDESVFLNNGADTDEDMKDLSSDSDEVSLEGAQKLCDVNKTNYFLHGKCANAVGKQPLEKRNSLGTTHVVENCAPSMSIVDRQRISLLHRNRTISSISSDRTSFKRKTDKELLLNSSTTESAKNPNKVLPFVVTCTSSPARHPRRAQLLQQYSDPQSLPTTTEDDTCSTLNTELYAGMESVCPGEPGTGSTATTITQHSSLNTVISYGHSSSLLTNNSPNHISTVEKTDTGNDSGKICSTSMSDSIIGPWQPIICMPSSLKDLILRGSGCTSGSHDEKLHITATKSVGNVSRSATNLGHFDTSMSSMKNIGNEDFESNKLSVMLELPLIKLPTGENSDSSTTSDEHEQSKSDEDESRDPSLPSSSRKWSKETLF